MACIKGHEEVVKWDFLKVISLHSVLWLCFSCQLINLLLVVQKKVKCLIKRYSVIRKTLLTVWTAQNLKKTYFPKALPWIYCFIFSWKTNRADVANPLFPAGPKSCLPTWSACNYVYVRRPPKLVFLLLPSRWNDSRKDWGNQILQNMMVKRDIFLFL